jgi:hypothetical protein
MRTLGWFYGARVQVLGSEPRWAREAFLDGLANVSGSVDGPVGHLYQHDNYLVLTDSDGFVHAMRVTLGGCTAAEALAKHTERDASAGTYAGL